MVPMNRAERRRLEKQQKKTVKERTYTFRESDLEKMIYTPAVQEMIERKVAERILEIDANYTLDLDTMVIWTLYQRGHRAEWLKKFYTDMFRWHRKLRAHYEVSETFPERKILKEKGIDVEAWFNELFDENGNYKANLEEFCGDLH